MLTGLLHRLVAMPWIYDSVQTLVGAKKVRSRLAMQVKKISAPKMVLDIGGGTGLVGELYDRNTKYVCLDIDPVKLRGFLAKNPGGIGLLADAGKLPLADGSVDMVVCTNVTHHLQDELLDRMFAETARVLTAHGKFVLSDALWAPERKVGKFIWSVDRGSFPRPEQTLKSAIEKHLTISEWDQFAVWHEYFVCTMGKKS
jgi:ubiquinone/menaquinone biosynthesis C-methylase UbiE